jgi:hypothetical protein
MELPKGSKALIGINLIKRGSFSLSNILNTQKILDYKVKDMAKAANSMLTSTVPHSTVLVILRLL